MRVHAYRPFPGAELAAVLSQALHVTVFDRAAAFGSLGPLGADVASLGLGARVTNVVGGLGGVDVTPSTLRWALEQRAGAAVPLYVPEGV